MVPLEPVKPVLPASMSAYGISSLNVKMPGVITHPEGVPCMGGIYESAPVAPATPVEPVRPLPPVTPVAPVKPEAPVAPL